MASPERPLGVGEILDRSFHIFRKHYAPAFIIMLICLGPVYLISEAVTFDLSGASFFPGQGITFQQSIDQFIDGIVTTEEEIPLSLVFLFLLMPLYFAFVLPIMLTSHLHLVKLSLAGEPVTFGKLFKSSFRRYWPAVGNMFLFGFVLLAIYIAIFIFLIVFLGITGAIVASVGTQVDFAEDPFGSSAVFLIVFIFVYAIFLFVSAAAIYIGMIRFGYFHPAVVLERESVGLRRSWTLTRRSFWRIFAVFWIVSVVFSVFSFVSYVVLVLLKMSLIGHLLSVLLHLLFSPMLLIPYAVVYFDQKNRVDGADLEAAIEARQTMEVQYGG